MQEADNTKKRLLCFVSTADPLHEKSSDAELFRIAVNYFFTYLALLFSLSSERIFAYASLVIS